MRLQRTNVLALLAAIVVFGAGGPWLASHLRSLPGAAPLAARADQRIATLEVLGLADDAVRTRVADALRQTPGVTAAELRPQQDRAYVVCAKSVADSALVAVVTGAGAQARAVGK